MGRLLDAAHQRDPFEVVIHGDFRGADKLAKAWAKSRGIPEEPYPADWGSYGKAAGPKRNQRMLDEGKPDIVVAFPGGDGTKDMTDRARAAHIRVVDIKAEP